MSVGRHDADSGVDWPSLDNGYRITPLAGIVGIDVLAVAAELFSLFKEHAGPISTMLVFWGRVEMHDWYCVPLAVKMEMAPLTFSRPQRWDRVSVLLPQTGTLQMVLLKSMAG